MKVHKILVMKKNLIMQKATNVLKWVMQKTYWFTRA